MVVCRAVVEPLQSRCRAVRRVVRRAVVETLRGRRRAVCRAVRRDDAELVVETVQSRS